MFPEDLRYTAEHEWVRMQPGSLRVGITDYAQEALDDIVFVTLPDVGAVLEAGQPFGEVESTKSVSDLYAPVSGTVVSCNAVLESQPELPNADPYGEGGGMEMAPPDPTWLDGLLGSAQYQPLVEKG